MLGNIILDSFNHSNFNTSFPNQKSNTLLYLLKWQYFWWFWFSYVFILYYLIINNHILSKLQKFNPQIYTSMKAHGKWGDLVICILPVFWCLNILSNSNTLLKIIEWQTESSLIVLRVRGKQWYWVYKLDITNPDSINNLKLNIGNNNKLSLDSYNKSIFFENIWLKKFLNKHNSNTSFSSLVKIRSSKNILNKKNNSIAVSRYKNHNHLEYSNYNVAPLCYKKTPEYLKLLFSLKTYSSIDINYNLIDLLKIELNSVESTLPDTNLMVKTKHNLLNNLSLKKNPLNKGVLFKFNYNEPSFLKNYRRHWVTLIQKPLKDWKKLNSDFIKVGYNNFYDNFLKNNHLINEQKKFALVNNRRLLTTNNVLVLPTNTNITVVTNSFDVVHSWFIPGLGLKMDCIPGRSTHHSLYIDTPGFYFGQCAEICGRFHHHMPIKLCALNYEHFLVWWHHTTINLYTETE